jgi:hypothetical protein
MLERSDHAEEGCLRRALTQRPGPLSTPMFHPFDIPQMAGHNSASSLFANRSLTTNSR